MVYIRYISNADYSGELNKLIFDAFGIENVLSLVKIGEHGKPYIENAPFDFSVSNTESASVIAICGEGGEIDNAVCIDINATKIGVDIECAEREIGNKSIKLIADKYFTNKELDYLYSNENDIKYRFLEIWTKKESIIKATGEGLSGISKADTFSKRYAHLQTKSIILNDKPYIVSIALF